MRSVWVTAPRRRTRSRPEASLATSFQVLGLHSVTNQNVLVPGLWNIETIRTGNDERPFLDQNDRSDLVAGTALHACNVSRRVGQQCIGIFPHQVVSKLAIAFLEEFFG